MTTTSSQETDGMLVEAVLDGQKERFADIVARYRPALFRLASSRLGCFDAAEDVVQETFLCAFKSLHTYDSKYSFRTWLWTILLNQINRHLKKANRTPRVDIGELRPAADCRLNDSVTPLGVVLKRERAQLLEQQLSNLPRMQADALRLRFFAGLKFHEIADAMGCGLSTAKNRVHCGLTKIGRMLSDYQSTESVAELAEKRDETPFFSNEK